MTMNRRNFLMSLGCMAIVPFVPKGKVNKQAQCSNILYDAVVDAFEKLHKNRINKEVVRLYVDGEFVAESVPFILNYKQELNGCYTVYRNSEGFFQADMPLKMKEISITKRKP